MANHKILMPFILSKEGGYSNNKNDRGGATMKGVTLTTFRSVYGSTKTVADLKAITDTQWEYIFKSQYWDRCKADGIKNQSVANMLVDFAYNSGVGNAARKIQKVVGTRVDGIIGPQTITAINNFKQGQWVLFDQLKVARISFLNGIVKNDPRQSVNLKGWMNRVRDIQYGKLIIGGKEIKV